MNNGITGFSIKDLLRYGLLVLTQRQGTALLVISLILLCIAGYLIGGINTSILYSKARYGKDIRESGSGNAGLTNMLRTYGKGAAAVTLLGDIAKTALCCLIGAIVLGKTGAFFCGYAAVIGHIWPVWFKFHGGKGVLSLATVILCCEPKAFLILITVFFIIVAFSKYISLGSVVCALLLPVVLSRFIGTTNLVIIPTVLVCLIIVWKHRSNIKRLREGNENKIHLGKDGQFLSNKILIPVAILLVAASVLSVFLTFRKTYAVSYGSYRISEAELRILFIMEKQAYFGDKEQNDDADEQIMNTLVEEAKRMIILTARANEDKRAISDSGRAQADSYFAGLASLPGYSDGDTRETYVHRIFGSDVSPSNVTAVLRAVIYVQEYEQSVTSEQAQRLVAESVDDVKVSDKVISSIVGKY